MKNSFNPPKIIPSSNKKTLRALIDKHPEIKIIDNYLDQIDELFTVTFPKHAENQNRKNLFIKKNYGETPSDTGNWIYFPWNNTIVHLLEKKQFQIVRTARNNPLITPKQQQQFENIVVGIVGLSVGSSIALTLAQSGGANTMKLADFDSLSLTNLNRIKASTIHLGLNKTHLIAQQIYEINPYANLILFDQGINPNSLISFFKDSPSLDLVIDEADDMVMKQFLRQAATALNIPLLMTTDNGFVSNTTILKSKKKIALDKVLEQFASSKSPQLSDAQKLLKIVSLVGKEHISHEMQIASMQKIKKSIAGWPQLAMTAFLGGSMATYATLLIALGKKTKKNQTTFSLQKHLNDNHNSQKEKKRRQKQTAIFNSFLKKLQH